MRAEGPSQIGWPLGGVWNGPIARPLPPKPLPSRPDTRPIEPSHRAPEYWAYLERQNIRATEPTFVDVLERQNRAERVQATLDIARALGATGRVPEALLERAQTVGATGSGENPRYGAERVGNVAVTSPMVRRETVQAVYRLAVLTGTGGLIDVLL